MTGIPFTVITLSPEQIDSGKYITPVSVSDIDTIDSVAALKAKYDAAMADGSTATEEEKTALYKAWQDERLLYTECWSCEVTTGTKYDWQVKTDTTTDPASNVAWQWEESATYNIVEFDLDDRLKFQTFTVAGDTTGDNSLTLTYGSDHNYSIMCTNLYDDYDLTLTKVSAAGTENLGGAAIARYKVLTYALSDYGYDATSETTIANTRDGAVTKALDAAKNAILAAWNGTGSSATVTNAANALANQTNYAGYLQELENASQNYKLSTAGSSKISGITGMSDAAALYTTLKECNAVAEISDPDKVGDYFCYAYFYNDGTSDSVYAYILMDYQTTTDTGTLSYEGLSDDGYVFREVVAPTGYQINDALQTFGKKESLSTAQTTTIKDTPAAELPMTGDVGTQRNYTIGFALMLLATFAASMLRRKQRGRGGG